MAKAGADEEPCWREDSLQASELALTSSAVQTPCSLGAGMLDADFCRDDGQSQAPGCVLVPLPGWLSAPVAPRPPVCSGVAPEALVPHAVRASGDSAATALGCPPDFRPHPLQAEREHPEPVWQQTAKVASVLP